MLMAQRREPPGIVPGGTIDSTEKSGKRSVPYERCMQYRYNEDKLKVIGSLLPSNNVDEGGPLLQVLDMLEDVDILRLSHTCSTMRGILQQYLAHYYKGKKPVLQLALWNRKRCI